MKFKVISLGCPKNLVESEYLSALLRDAGHELDENGEAILINTCAFISEAARESIETILEAKKDAAKKVIVTGCLVERYREKLVDLLPEADIFIGRGYYREIAAIIGKRGFYHRDGIFSETFPRTVLTSRPTAYLKIQEGCNNRCHYCTIPAIRGSLASRKEKDILDEFRWLREQGFSEINLIGQDITSYGTDSGPRALPALVRSILEIPGDYHLRLLYMHPNGITEDLIRLMKSDERIIPYLDVPIQHSEDRILSLMGRGHTRSYLEKTLGMMREILPEAMLRTSIIVGFPTETDDEFDALLSFLNTYQFDMLGAFMYAREEGTIACKLKGQIRQKIKRERYARLMDQQKEISRVRLSRLLGTSVQVIVEDAGSDPKVGRMLTQAPDIDGLAFIKGECRTGDIRAAKIVKTLDYDVVVEV
ncbi:MAG: 30S ribosomal protein S12 methylthiotransferase RimO [Syntrophorhabdus sp.]